jgi:hypothetical protein
MKDSSFVESFLPANEMILTQLNCWGHSYLEFLQALEERVDQDWAGVSSSLEEIRTSLLSKNGCLINMTADGKNLTNSEKYVSKFLDLLPSKSSVEAAAWNARLSPGNEAIVIPTQVKKLFPCLLFRLLFWLPGEISKLSPSTG